LNPEEPQLIYINWVKFCHLALLFEIGQLGRELNNDLETQNSWSKQWFITFNADKTKYLIFSIKPNKFTHPSLILTGTQIPDPPFSSFGPSRDYGMDLCLEVYL
jgi:hypothetical protein